MRGGIYILDIYLQGQRHALVDERGSVCHLRSVEHARDLLRDLPELPFHLVQQSPYDEMCGLADGVRGRCAYPSACVRSGEARQGVC